MPEVSSNIGYCYVGACVPYEPSLCEDLPVFATEAICKQAYSDMCGNCLKCNGPGCTPDVCSIIGWCVGMLGHPLPCLPIAGICSH
jgi:hypothetical protein